MKTPVTFTTSHVRCSKSTAGQPHGKEAADRRRSPRASGRAGLSRILSDPALVVPAVLALAAAGAIVTYAPASTRKADELSPATIGQLLALPPADLPRVGIAQMNL